MVEDTDAQSGYVAPSLSRREPDPGAEGTDLDGLFLQACA